MSGALDGKAAVVTGGGTGIGAAIARLFAAEGARVAVAGRRRKPLERVAADIGGIVVPTDVSEEDGVRALFARCESAFGGLDVLVNNAGDPGSTVPVEDQDVESWDRTFAVNTRAVILCIKHALPHLKRTRGAIVNVTSDSVHRPKALRSAYAGSKMAVLGITQSVAHEVGHVGVRVNVLAPGATQSEMLGRVFAERARSQGIPEAEVYARSAGTKALRRLSAPDEVARAALFLASDAAAAITGELVTVDCGQA
ncbi:MAG: SDR family oxidoreductase [Rhodospirillales bacterium]|nr:SDR family oxidoreductase [Rhodospirillales bacterium]